MSSSTPPTPDPEVVVIKEKEDNGNVWMWAIFGIILVAIILIIVGVCMSNKHHKKLVYLTQAPSAAMSSGSGSGASLMGGASLMSVAPVSASVLNSSMAPMSFMPY
jgi:hypothetical protein